MSTFAASLDDRLEGGDFAKMYDTTAHASLLSDVQRSTPGVTFTRIVCGLDGYYVLALAPHEGWYYGPVAKSSLEAVVAFDTAGPVRIEKTLLPTYVR